MGRRRWLGPGELGWGELSYWRELPDDIEPGRGANRGIQLPSPALARTDDALIVANTRYGTTHANVSEASVSDQLTLTSPIIPQSSNPGHPQLNQHSSHHQRYPKLCLIKAPDNLRQRLKPAPGKVLVTLVVRMHPVARHAIGIEARPAIHDGDGALVRRDSRRPLRDCVIELGGAVWALGALGGCDGDDLGELCCLVSPLPSRPSRAI